MIDVKKRWPLILLSIIIIYAFFIRVYDLSEQSLWIDESFSIIAAEKTLEKGIPLLDSGVMYDRSILHTYLLSFSFLFGINEWNARIISVIFGILFIILGFKFAKDMHSERAGLICSFLIAFSYYQIAWSRQARMYTQLEFFFWLSLYFFYIWTTSKHTKYAVLTLLSTICTILTHDFGYALFAIYPLYLLSSPGVAKSFYATFKKWLRNQNLFVSIVSIATIVTILLFALFFVFSKLASHLEYNKFDYFTTYFSFLRHEWLLPILLSIFGVIFLRKQWKSVYLLLLSFIPVFLVLSFLYDTVNLRYLFFIIPALFFMSSMYIAELTITRQGKLLAVIILFILVLYSNLIFIPQSIYYLEPDTPQPDFKHLYRWLKATVPDYMNQKYTVSETAIHHFYMQKSPEYWVRFSFTGTKQGWEFDNRTTEIYTNATIVKDTVNGSIGIYDLWSTHRRGFSADIENAIVVGDFYVVGVQQ